LDRGNASEFASRLCFVPPSRLKDLPFALGTPSAQDGFVRPADPTMGKMIVWMFCVLSVLLSLRSSSAPSVWLWAPAHGDRGRSFEHSLVVLFLGAD
jgi:hypothetical protein